MQLPDFRNINMLGPEARAALNLMADYVRMLASIRGGEQVLIEAAPGRGLSIDIIPDDSPRDDKWFLAKITGSASLATNRWKYAWTEVLLNGDTVVTRTEGRSGTTTTDYAVNLAEMFHTATYAWGVSMTGDYPAGFDPVPIGSASGGAHAYDVVVWMRELYDVDGAVKYVFNMMGSHDGTCS